MPLYGAMDLHANNTYAVVLDDHDRCLLDKRLPNRLDVILRELEPYRSELAGVAVESTFNWYWLVDGLMDHGYCAKLVNTCAVQQYDGLKFTDDRHDARWLAHLDHLGILPTGYIYPKEQRPIRDLLRQRSTFVHRRTAHLLGLQNVVVRNTGNLIKGNALKRLTPEEVYEQLADPHLVLGAEAHLAVIETFNTQIGRLEKAVLAHGRLQPSFRVLKSIGGVGQTLALTIMYETGELERFPGVGNYVSYCRLVQSQRRSNGKKKGEGNRKNGNPYLSWAFSEAATFALRFQPLARRYYDRKRSKTCHPVAIRAVAHKLARASFYMLRDQTIYEPKRLFC